MSRKCLRHDLRGRLSGELGLTEYILTVPQEEWDIDEMKAIAKISKKAINEILGLADKCAEIDQKED